VQGFKTLSIMTNLEIWVIKLIGVFAIACPFIIGLEAFGGLLCLTIWTGGFTCYCVGNIMLREQKEALQKENTKLEKKCNDMFNRIVALEEELRK
jgi:hypothetical protein